MKMPSFFKKYLDRGSISVNPLCSEFEVGKSRVSEFVIQQLVPIVGVTPFPLDELMLMVSTICRFSPTHIFEWGTHVGKSARIFHEANRKFGVGAEIHSIDLPDDVQHVEHPGHKRGELVRHIKEVRLHQGDGVAKFLEIYAGCGEGCRPLIFLDGDHDYQTVKRELDTIFSKVKEPTVLLHDTFYQSAESGYNVGPHRAIMDTLPTLPPSYQAMSLSMGLPGMTLLYRSGPVSP